MRLLDIGLLQEHGKTSGHQKPSERCSRTMTYLLSFGYTIRYKISLRISGAYCLRRRTLVVFLRSLVGIVLPNTVDKYPDSQRSQSRDTK